MFNIYQNITGKNDTMLPAGIYYFTVNMTAASL